MDTINIPSNVFINGDAQEFLDLHEEMKEARRDLRGGNQKLENEEMLFMGLVNSYRGGRLEKQLETTKSIEYYVKNVKKLLIEQINYTDRRRAIDKKIQRLKDQKS